MTDNICKFVTTTSEKQIFTTNFVLEHNLELLKHIDDPQHYSIRIVLSAVNGQFLGMSRDTREMTSPSLPWLSPDQIILRGHLFTQTSHPVHLL